MGFATSQVVRVESTQFILFLMEVVMRVAFTGLSLKCLEQRLRHDSERRAGPQCATRSAARILGGAIRQADAQLHININ